MVMTGQNIANGGVQYVPQIAVQYVYLDFDGELTSYNGEILTVENVEVQNSSLTKERIENILAELNAKYASQNVIFVAEKPAVAEYSTIYVGKTEAFAPYGNFAGVAETIDCGNENKSDNAFVMLDSTASDEAIISTIAHETDHLLGTLDHGGSGLSAYAYMERFDVYNGQVSNGLTLEELDTMYVSNGGTAKNIHVGGEARIYVSSGGTASNTIVSGGTLIVKNGGKANVATVKEGGLIDVSSGAKVSNAVLESHGGMYVSNGGTAVSAAVNTLGSMFIHNGGAAVTVKENGGYVEVASGATVTFAANTISRAYVTEAMTVHKNTVVNSANINNGTLHIYSGGIVNAVTADKGSLAVYSGGSASNVSVTSNTRLIITVASNTYIQGTCNGSAFEMKNAKISSCSVHDMYISSGASADSIFVRNAMVIYNGGTANNTVVDYGGRMTISGGVHKGALQINNQAYVGVTSGGVIDFTVSVRSASDGYLINNLSLISGTPTYTITVSANQADGTYKLAQGASSFTGTITIGNGSTNYGSITVNGSDFVYGGKSYSLDQVNGNLTLTVGAGDVTPPGKPVASANITTITNKDVVVTATFSSDTAVKQYSLNNSTWYTYTDGVTMTANGSVYFRGQDSAGNISDVTICTVANIDKTAPELSCLPKADISGQTAVISWDAASDNNAVSYYVLTVDGTEYKVDSTSYTLENLTEGTHTCTLTAYDTAGNYNKSEEYEFTITTGAIGGDEDSEWMEDLSNAVFISSKYTSSKIDGKKQNGVELFFNVNAFEKAGYVVNAAEKFVVVVDSKINGNDYAFLGKVAAAAVTVTEKINGNSYAYTAAYTAKNTLNITENTGSTEFLRFATVNINDASVENVSGGKRSSGTNMKSVYNHKTGNSSDTAKNTESNSAVGKFTAVNGATADNVSGYATVKLTGSLVNKLTGGTVSKTDSDKNVYSGPKEQYTVSQTFNTAASGNVTLTSGASAGSIAGYSNVTLTDSTAGDITNFTSKDSKSDNITYDTDKVTRKVTLSHTETTAGTLKATNSTLGDVTGFATVTLKNVTSAGDFRRESADGKNYSTVKKTLAVKTNKKGLVTGTYTKTETFTRSGKFTATGSTVGDIENFSNVTLDGSEAESISNFETAKIVTKGSTTWENAAEYGRPEAYALNLQDWNMEKPVVTNSLNGTVTLKNGASADSITNFKSVTMTKSKVGTITNVGKVTVNKGDSSIKSYVGTNGNDTVTIAKGAVLTANKIDLGAGDKDKLAINGTLILTGTEIKAAKITGKGEIAVIDDLFSAVEVDFANILNVGETAENFRGTAYENADNTASKAVKWDGKSAYNGWLGAWEGYKEGSDTVDYIKFKAEAGDKLTVTGVEDWIFVDKKGNNIGKEITAAGDYTIQLKHEKDTSISYKIELA